MHVVVYFRMFRAGLSVLELECFATSYLRHLAVRYGQKFIVVTCHARLCFSLRGSRMACAPPGAAMAADGVEIDGVACCVAALCPVSAARAQLVYAARLWGAL